MPIAPTLILGLGGTGSKIVRKVSETVRESETGQSERIAYVVFDTDINDLGTIRRENPDIFTVQTSTTNTVGEYLGINTNARDNWFPVNEMLNRKTLTEGAAQVRAISRLAFDTTLKSGNLTELHRAIEKLFRIDKEQKEQALRVIITGSLAGGTGSGLLLSVAMYLSNYLKSKYPKAKAITRGFFVQPDVFYSVIPASEEQQNLQVNAYAAVRELDAFLMKGDNTLPEQYRGLEFEFPRIGADGVEVVNAMPYDFCFLFDAKNKQSAGLDSFDAYLDHAATCIYTQSIGPMSKKSNSREDNVLREVIKNDGRNRYAGAGASRMVYPWQHVRDVTGFTWANAALSGQWLQFDRQFYELQAATLQQREAGHNVRDLDRAQEFIMAVDQSANNKETFAMALRNQCLVFDEEGFATGENRWEAYVRALEDYVQGDQNLDPGSEAMKQKVRRGVGSLAEELESNVYSNVYRELTRLKTRVEGNAQERAGVMGYTLYKSDNIAVTQQRDEHRLETYLREPQSGNFVHPVASRYFLYNLVKTLQQMKDRTEADLKEVDEFFETFERRYFDDAKTEEVETADMYAAKPVTFKEKIRRKPSREKEDMVVGFHQYLSRIDLMESRTIFNEVLVDALEYVNGIITAFEKFFASLDSNIERLGARIGEEKIKYDELSGSTTRYVLATSDCLDSLLNTMPYTGGSAKLDSQLCADIYAKVRAYHMLTDEKDEGYFKDLYTHTILGYFTDQVMQTYSAQIKIDVIEALEREYRIKFHNYEEDNVRHYVIGEIDKVKQLASPFIEQPLGEERHPISACAFNPALEGDSNPKRKSLISEHLGNYGGERDSEISPQEILFYNAIYGIRARDLGKFAAERHTETESRPAGSYFKAYYNLVSGIKPSVGETKVITPHIDRRWHSISRLPDLDEDSQAQQLFNIHRALILGLAHKRIDWTAVTTGSRNVYRFKGEKDRDEDFVVSNGTPCDQFYEVVDGLTINPVAVDTILKDVEQEDNRRREQLRMATFEQMPFGKALSEGIRLHQLEADFAEEFAETRLSLLGVAAFYAMSIPAEEYVEDLLFSMSENFLQILREEVEKNVDADDVQAEMLRILTAQFEAFESNVNRFLMITGRSFGRKLRTILRPLLTFVRHENLGALEDRVEALDDRLR